MQTETETEQETKNGSYAFKGPTSTQIEFLEDLKKYDPLFKSAISGSQYVIVSDGAGHYAEDKVGGAATVVLSLMDLDTHPNFLIKAQNQTTVMRMEFEGLLMGLEHIQRDENFYPGCNVLWLCDNKTLIDLVNLEGKPKKNEDLWCLYHFYERNLNVRGVFIPRDNKMLLHNLCDLHASTSREILLDYIQTSVEFTYGEEKS